jgi:uncharacterized membrane protein
MKTKSTVYYQIILTNGKTYEKLYKTPQNAIKAVGVKNIKQLREIPRDQVDNRYVDNLI